MKTAVLIIIFCFAILSSTAQASDRHQPDAHRHISVTETLSPHLRELLGKEMQALQMGMMAVIPAYVSANWGEIESIADNMKNGYILKQNLSDEEVKELHSKLPESFLQLDENFHYLSGMLAHAAKNKKVELVGFYFSRLSESCVNCHSQFAQHKFPGFASESPIQQHDH